MADIFQSVIAGWTQLGFFQYLFPFLLALAIIYGVLEWALGGKERRMPKSAIALVSLILSFFVMLFAGSNPGIVTFLTNLSGSMLIIMSGILFIIIMLGLLGFKTEKVFEKGKSMWALVLAVIIIVVVIVFGAGGGMFVSAPGWVASSDLWTVVFFIVILAVVLLLMGQESNGDDKKSP